MRKTLTLITAPLLSLALLGASAHAEEAPPTTTEFVPLTWDTITPEQYERAPFIGGWPWCSPGEFPESYEWEAPCNSYDPCLPGGSRLWYPWIGRCDPYVDLGEGGVPPLTLPAPTEAQEEPEAPTTTTTPPVVSVVREAPKSLSDLISEDPSAWVGYDSIYAPLVRR